MMALQSLLGADMAAITIRNIDDEVKNRLRLQAAQHGCSMEQEVRDILSHAVLPKRSQPAFAQRIQKHFASLELDALPIPERQLVRTPPAMGS
jgi:plasmid stability protein